ncbi:hypothetical protein CAP31_12490 [Sulfuriferula sp. AH1]|uniref:metallophosphoesterase n=1 Tax=Sulfuriferula sp. AH1 TaxID=1985873 RepID=UPI000B3B5AF8|nr:metallophosphoesterase [Sulfuriferula sp. AH1]ARU32424.1 hypothetical protein CAP31_12490 [Sulfuriferula sp. AH1]
MKLALYSDLHLEFLFPGWEPPALDVDVIILAGDIDKHVRGIEWAAATFPDKPVIYVVGNHEFYDADIGIISDMRKTAARLGIHFLENDAIKIEGVRFLGTTLWSDFALYGNSGDAMRVAQRYINDYSEIRKQGGLIEPEDTAALYHTAAAWLDDELSKPFHGKTVVVTHFAPHRGCVAAEFVGGALTPYFTADMAPLMAKHKIALWAFGHTHGNVDFESEHGCRIISNQRGYPNEFSKSGNGFRENLVIDV